MYNACMKKPTKRILFVLVILSAIVAILVGMYTFTKTDVVDAIDSFKECAAAGYPIMESYPEQCATPDGRTFTNAGEAIVD